MCVKLLGTVTQTRVAGIPSAMDANLMIMGGLLDFASRILCWFLGFLPHVLRAVRAQHPASHAARGRANIHTVPKPKIHRSFQEPGTGAGRCIRLYGIPPVTLPNTRNKLRAAPHRHVGSGLGANKQASALIGLHSTPYQRSWTIPCFWRPIWDWDLAGILNQPFSVLRVLHILSTDSTLKVWGNWKATPTNSWLGNPYSKIVAITETTGALTLDTRLSSMSTRFSEPLRSQDWQATSGQQSQSCQPMRPAFTQRLTMHYLPFLHTAFLKLRTSVGYSTRIGLQWLCLTIKIHQ